MPDPTPLPVPDPTPTLIPGMVAMTIDESIVAGPSGSGTMSNSRPDTPRPTPDSPRYDPYGPPYTQEELEKFEEDHVGVLHNWDRTKNRYADMYALAREWNSGRSMRE